MTSIRQLFLLIKRILTKQVMAIVLIFIPAVICTVSLLPGKVMKTEIVSGVYIEGEDEYTHKLLCRLQDSSTGFTFTAYPTGDALIKAVQSGEIDSGYIIPKGIENILTGIDKDNKISVIISDETSFDKVTSETVYASLLTIYAPHMAISMLREKYDIPDYIISHDDIVSYITEHYDGYIADGDIFQINTSLSGSYKTQEYVQPNNFPVDTFVYITIFICGLTGLLCFMKDMDSGVYNALPVSGKWSFAMKNIAAGIIPAAILNLLSLLFYMRHSFNMGYIVGLVICTMLTFIICILLKCIFRSYRAYVTAMPYMIICTLLLSLLASL